MLQTTISNNISTDVTESENNTVYITYNHVRQMIYGIMAIRCYKRCKIQNCCLDIYVTAIDLNTWSRGINALNKRCKNRFSDFFKIMYGSNILFC